MPLCLVPPYGAAGSETRPRPRPTRGAETCTKVEEAAGRLFTQHGYYATTLQPIADAAGVHVQTVYLAYGTKAAVLRAAAAWATSEEDPAIPPPDRRWVRAIVATDEPRLKLRLYVRHIRDITQTWGPFQQAMRAASAEPGDMTRRPQGIRPVVAILGVNGEEGSCAMPVAVGWMRDW
jgi:AcrR family transcriptional regulator